MNNNNLKPLNTLTKSEQREIQKKGAEASVAARKERKKLKEALLLMLANKDIQNDICTAIIEKARGGDLRAFEIIRDTIGEKPVDKLAQTDAEGNNAVPPVKLEIVPVKVVHSDYK